MFRNTTSVENASNFQLVNLNKTKCKIIVAKFCFLRQNIVQLLPCDFSSLSLIHMTTLNPWYIIVHDNSFYCFHCSVSKLLWNNRGEIVYIHHSRHHYFHMSTLCSWGPVRRDMGCVDDGQMSFKFSLIYTT